MPYTSLHNLVISSSHRRYYFLYVVGNSYGVLMSYRGKGVKDGIMGEAGLAERLKNAEKERDYAWNRFWAALDDPSSTKVPLSVLLELWERHDDIVKVLRRRSTE